MNKKTKGLGMGLDALLGGKEAALDIAASTTDRQQDDAAGTAQLPIAKIRPGHYQPRDHFDDDALASLADSIGQHGVLQPIVVRLRADATHPYEILAGERRFRAAQLAGLREIPAIVREADNEQALALALIENIQREDLNPLEEAKAIARLVEEFDYSHEKAARAIGRSRSATSNLLRLLSLAPPVHQHLLDGAIEMGHARALLALSRADQIMLGHRVVERGLSVRETESEVTAHLANLESNPKRPTTGGAGRPSATEADRDLLRLQARLSDILAAPVAIRANRKGRGKLTIQFSGPDQFEGLIDQLGLRDKLDQ